MLGAVVLRMLFRQTAKSVMVKLAVVLGLTYACAIYLLLRPDSIRPDPLRPGPGWTALFVSLVLFGFAFILHRIDFHKSEREGERKRSADVGEGEPAGPKAGGKSTPLIWKTLHACWHILAAGGTSALFYTLCQ